MGTTTEKFITLSGAKIFYTQTNNQHPETMLMIHAGICDQRMWQAQVEHFSANYHVVTFDIHGFGQSGTPNSPFAFHTDIKSLLDALQISHTWILACSFGGQLAIDFTLHYPDYVQGLILSGSALGGYRFQGERHPVYRDIDQAEDAGDLERVCELEIQLWVDGEGRTPQDMPPAMRQLVYDMNLIALKTDEAFWDLEIEPQPPAIERLSMITVPTLLIIGDLDIEPSIERTNILESAIAGAKKVAMAGTAHLPNMEQPVIFNTIVDDFLASV